MAVTVLGNLTLDNRNIYLVDSSPAVGGLEAEIGSFGSVITGEFFIKTGATDFDWEQMATSGSLSGMNVLLVRKNPQTGQYATIEDAINAITSPSSTNRWLISVGVGEFEENELMLPTYTSVVGASIQETVIKPLGAHDLFHITDVFNEISFCSLQSVQSGFSAVFCDDSGDYAQLHKVNFVDNDTNVKVVALTQDTVMYMEYCDVNGTMTYGVYVDGSSGFRATVNTENWYTFPTATGFIGNFATGADASLIIKASGLYGNVNPNLPALSGTKGVVCQNGAIVTIDSAEIASQDYGLHNLNVGSGCVIRIAGTIFHNNNTFDFSINHPSTDGGMVGSADLSKVFVDSSSTFTPAFTNTQSQGGMVIVGDIYNGAKLSEVCEVTTFLANQGVGVIEGGELTDGGTFDVDVNAGIGYLNDGVLKKITWSSQSITLAANTTYYIYFNPAGTLSSATSLPNTISNILLGKVRTNGSGIEFIDEIPITAQWSDNKTDNWQRDVFGSLYEAGSIVSENATPFKLDVTGGIYYYGSKEFDPSGGSAIVFDKFYQDGSGGWTIVPAVDLVPNDKYDNGSGTLQNLTASYFAKHLLLLVGDGVNEKYFLVYAQSEWSTLGDAETADLPTVPDYFSEGVVRVASIIIQQGAGNISEILSERPLPTTQTSASAPVTSHLALTDLNTGNAGHNQFLMLDGSTAMVGDLDMGANDVINAGTYNGVTVEAHASRHLPNGADPLTTAAPTSNLSGTSTNDVGIQNSFARSDHSHAIDGAALTKADDTNVTLTLGGSPTTALLNAASLTLGWTGQLSIARGGTGASTANDALNALLPSQTGNAGKVLTTDGTNTSWTADGGGTVTSFSAGNLSPLFTTSVATATTTPALSFALSNAAANTWFGNNTGSSAAPSYNSSAALTRTNDTNVTLTLGGSPTTALLNAASLTLGWTGTLANSRGGLGADISAGGAIGDLLVATSASAFGRLADVAAGSYLRSGGVGAAPVWSTLTLPNAATTGDLLYASASNTISALADVATGNALISGGVGVAPSWGKIGLTTHVSGVLPEANGGTNQSTYATGDMLYASAANTLSKRAIGTAGQSLTPVGGVPTWVTNATAQSTPADPATTTSTTGVMMGLAGSITPTKSGSVLIVISGDIDNGTSGNGAQVQMRTGTGAAPVNGAALTGTTRGGLVKVLTPTNNAGTTCRVPFSLNCLITGLTVGTAVWIDVGLAAITGGTARIRDISISAIEQ